MRQHPGAAGQDPIEALLDEVTGFLAAVRAKAVGHLPQVLCRMIQVQPVA